MPRTARKYIDSEYVHVVVQGINKEYVFDLDDDKRKFIHYIYKFQDECEVELLAYCVMSNHAHLLIHIPNIKNLGNYMKKCNQSYADYYNKCHERVGVLFRNRYHSEEIYDFSYLENCIKYIHNNPVKAKMVFQAIDYPYSSYHNYVNRTGVFLNKSVLEIIGKQINYEELLGEAQYISFIDIDEDKAQFTQEELIQAAIMEYVHKYNTNLVNILSDKKEFVRFYYFLINKNQIKFDFFSKFFSISKHYHTQLIRTMKHKIMIT